MDRLKRACGAAGLKSLASRFLRQTQGNVAMMFAMALPVLLMITLGAIDIHQASKVKAQLQDALDAAALAAARSSFTDDVNINKAGMAALKANMPGYFGETSGDTASFDLVDDERVVAQARVNVKVLVANVVLPPYGKLLDDYLPVSASTEVLRPTRDIEVSLVLDITGSMEGSRLTDLQKAANDLVELLILEDQSVNRTRMALAPYSMGVNAGDYLDVTRGKARGATAITDASWMVSGSQKTISGVTKADEAVFTANNHGYDTGNFVWISGVTDSGSGSDLAGWLNGRVYRVVRITSNTFKLERWDGSRWSVVSTTGRQNYASNSGIARRCHAATCEVVVTSDKHALSTGEDVRILNVGGMTQINTQNSVEPASRSSVPFYQTVTKLTDTTFALNGVVGPTTTLGNYSKNTGTVQCLEYGCESFLFTNNENNRRIFWASSCVSERVGPEAYTDAAPSTDVVPATATVAFSYVGTTNVGQGGCMSTTFTPLTSNRETLTSHIDKYKAEGGTAGQIGVGWGWYLISPNFGAVFPEESRPEPYGTRGLVKVAIIMTDGEFNAVYYDGVRARDSGTGGGTNERWINHDSNNGSPFLQSVRMCEAMREQGIIIYTVGFDISDANDRTPNTVDTAAEVMRACATSPEHVYLPKSGASLKDAFAAIGRSISQLRIAK